MAGLQIGASIAAILCAIGTIITVIIACRRIDKKVGQINVKIGQIRKTEIKGETVIPIEHLNLYQPFEEKGAVESNENG